MVTSIQVVGNVHIPASDILAAICTKVGQVYSEQQVKQDHEAILALGWFSEVSIDRAATETGIALTYRVTENPVVSAVNFQGNTAIGTALLQSVMKIKPGQVYSNLLMRQDRERILQLYNAQGYIYTEVWRSMTDEGVLTVTVMEGVIEAIRITGNTKTKDKVIRRYIRTKPGDIYNDKCVAADVNRLAATNWFESVQRTSEMGSEAGKIIVNITVVERKTTGQATVGGGYTSVEGVVAFVNVSKENLWGTGQAVSVQGDFGGISSYEAYYRNPWIMTPETRLNLGVYNSMVVREAFVNSPTGQQTVMYDEHREGGSVTFGRPLSDQTIVYVGFRDDKVSLADLTTEQEALLTGPAFQPSDVRGINAALANDTRDNRDFPRCGGFQQLLTEFAGLLGGSSNFDKYTGDIRHYFPIGPKDTFAMRLLVGTMTGNPPYLEEFMVGGTESLRGYQTDQFVGTNLALLNTELRIPMGKKLIGVVFVDVGDAWGGPTAAETEGDLSFTPHVGYGVGVRVAVPAIGPIRLDFGFGSGGMQTHFGISQMF